MKTNISLSAAVIFAILSSEVFAKDTLSEKEGHIHKSNQHLSLQQFQQELGVYPQVNASISSEGVVTLTGHVDGGVDKNIVEQIATNLSGTTSVVNLITTD